VDKSGVDRRGAAYGFRVRVLVTGANGYIGLRLIQALREAGHGITAVVRDRRRFPADNFGDGDSGPRVFEADFLDEAALRDAPGEIDAAYYLIHVVRLVVFADVDIVSAGAQSGGFADARDRLPRIETARNHSA